MSKTRPVRPAGEAAEKPRLAEALGSPGRDLALQGAAGEPASGSQCHLAFDTEQRRHQGHRAEGAVFRGQRSRGFPGRGLSRLDALLLLRLQLSHGEGGLRPRFLLRWFRRWRVGGVSACRVKRQAHHRRAAERRPRRGRGERRPTHSAAQALRRRPAARVSAPEAVRAERTLHAENDTVWSFVVNGNVLM